MAQTSTTYPVTPCSPASHEALKLDAARWAALPLVGRQVTPADETGPAETLTLRNCPACNSTLAVVERQRLLDLFDAAFDVDADLDLSDTKIPGASDALWAWAAARGLNVSYSVTAKRNMHGQRVTLTLVALSSGATFQVYTYEDAELDVIDDREIHDDGYRYASEEHYAGGAL